MYGTNRILVLNQIHFAHGPTYRSPTSQTMKPAENPTIEPTNALAITYSDGSYVWLICLVEGAAALVFVCYSYRKNEKGKKEKKEKVGGIQFDPSAPNIDEEDHEGEGIELGGINGYGEVDHEQIVPLENANEGVVAGYTP